MKPKLLTGTKRSDTDGYLDFQNNDAEKIVRIVKAITKPYPGAWGLIQGQKVRIYSAKISELAFQGTPGKTILTKGIKPVVICKKKALRYLIMNLKNSQIEDFLIMIGLNSSTLEFLVCYQQQLLSRSIMRKKT